MRGRRRREHGAAEEDLRRRGRGRGRGRRGAGRDGGGSVHGRRARGRVSPRRSPESESETAARKRESARRLETKKRREKRGGREKRRGGREGDERGKTTQQLLLLSLSLSFSFFSLSLSNSLSCSFTLFLLACVVYSLGSMGYLSSLPRDSFGMYLFEDYRVYTGICSHLNVPVVIDVAAGLIRGRAHESAADRVDLA